MYDCNGFSANPTWALPNYLVYPFPWMLIMLCNYLQNAVAIIYIYVLQQATFCFCNFLHLYFTINRALLDKQRYFDPPLSLGLCPEMTHLRSRRFS